MKRSRPRGAVAFVKAGQRLGDVLAMLSPQPQRAVLEGRVFVGGRRVDRLDWPLELGQTVEVFQPRPSPPTIEIIDEQGGVMAVHKPSGIATEPDRQGAAGCLLDALARALGVRGAELHALNRLDVNVSGVVLVARTAEARQWVEAARKQGGVARRYVAIGWGILNPAEGEWQTPVRTHRGGVARAACTLFRVVARSTLTLAGRHASLIALQPRTGRTHQLRAHCAMAGLPLLGDRAYGGPGRFVREDGSVQELDRVALHAAIVALTSPTGRMWTVRAKLPVPMLEWWESLQGSPSDWERALEGEVH